jgi:methylmalonyl-CoA mutase
MFEANFKSIFNDFKAQSAEQWKAKLIRDLKNKNYQDLVSYTEDRIEILPFFTEEDNHKYQLEIPKTTQHDCLNTEIVMVKNIEIANKEALYALENGTQAIIFDLENQELTEPEIRILTQGIQTEFAPIFFDNINANSKNMMIKILPESSIHKIFVPQQKSTVNELYFAIQHIFNSIEDNIRLHFVIGQDFFLEMSKLRAFRWLINQLNHINQTNKKVFIVSETGFENRNDEVLENNILRNTTEVMSAIMGGTHAVLVHPHENSRLGKRISRNIKNILSLESTFLCDDGFTAGNYYVEYLTHQLAQKVWEKLQVN